MKNVEKNPSKDKIAELIGMSEHTAAKWLKDSSNDDMYFWPAELYQHAHVAAQFGIANYTKGIAVND